MNGQRDWLADSQMKDGSLDRFQYLFRQIDENGSGTCVTECVCVCV
jgi:hypothetical protein